MFSTSYIGVDNECIKIYDPTKQELLATFDRYKDASRFLGLSDNIIKGAITSKTRRFSPTLNKEVAIRLASKKK
jgi:hypothetical protein